MMGIDDTFRQKIRLAWEYLQAGELQICARTLHRVAYEIEAANARIRASAMEAANDAR